MLSVFKLAFFPTNRNSCSLVALGQKDVFHYLFLPAALRGILCLLLALVLGCTLPQPAHASTDPSDVVAGRTMAERELTAESFPSLDATTAILMDDQGLVWFDRQSTEQAQIASLTKIMTALVAVDYLAASDSLEISASAASIKEASAGFIEGDQTTFEDALKAVLTASGNDAATAVAEAAGNKILVSQGKTGDTYEQQAAFIDAMNAKASTLGLANSWFTNPHGLDFDAFAQGQYSCARDVATLLRHAMQNPLIRASIGFSQVDITVMRGGYPTTLSLTNTDTLLRDYEGTCAAKTGFTAAAGPCLATAVNRNGGHEYYTVVLNSSSKAQRFIDSIALYDWVYTNRDTFVNDFPRALAPQPAEPVKQEPATTTYQLIASESSTTASVDGAQASYPRVAEVAHADWPGKTISASVLEIDKTLEVLSEKGPLERKASFDTLHNTVNRGDRVGAIAFYQGETLLWETNLIALETLNAPTWWEAAGIWFQHTFSWLLGAPAEAQSQLVDKGPQEVS